MEWEIGQEIKETERRKLKLEGRGKYSGTQRMNEERDIYRRPP